MARTVRIDIVGDNRSLKSALSQSEASLRGLEGAAAKSQASLGKLESGFAFFAKAGAVVAGASALTGAIRNVVDSASRLQQSQGAIDSVFQSNAESMQKAASAANDLGLSQSQYGELAVQLGSQLKNQGVAAGELAGQTQELIQLGTDLAATYGGSVTDAVNAISSLYRGENDPIEAYGVSIKQASVTALAATDGISEAAARTKILYEQTADAQGQWSREQGTFAVQSQKAAASLEDAKAALGKGLLPLFTTLAETAGGAGEALSSIPEGLLEFGTQAAVAFGAVRLLQTGLGKAAGSLTSYAASVSTTNATFTQAFRADYGAKLANNLSKVGNALPVIGAVVVGLTALDTAAQDAVASTRRSADELATALNSDLVVDIEVRDTGDTVQKAIDNLSALQGGVLQLDTGQLEADVNVALDAIEQLANNGNVPRAKEQFDLLRSALEQAGVDTSGFDFGGVESALDGAGAAAGEVAGDLDTAKGSFEEFAKSVDEATQELLDFQGLVSGAEDAYDSVVAAIEDATEAVGKQGDIWDETTKSWDRSTEASRDARKALFDVAEAAIEANGEIALRDGVDAAVRNTREARTAFIDLAQQSGLTRGEARALADQLGLIPEDVRSQYTGLGFTDGITETTILQNKLNALNGTVAYTRVVVRREDLSGDVAAGPNGSPDEQPTYVDNYAVQAERVGVAIREALDVVIPVNITGYFSDFNDLLGQTESRLAAVQRELDALETAERKVGKQTDVISEALERRKDLRQELAELEKKKSKGGDADGLGKAEEKRLERIPKLLKEARKEQTRYTNRLARQAAVLDTSGKKWDKLNDLLTKGKLSQKELEYVEEKLAKIAERRVNAKQRELDQTEELKRSTEEWVDEVLSGYQSIQQAVEAAFTLDTGDVFSGAVNAFDEAVAKWEETYDDNLATMKTTYDKLKSESDRLQNDSRKDSWNESVRAQWQKEYDAALKKTQEAENQFKFWTAVKQTALEEQKAALEAQFPAEFAKSLTEGAAAIENLQTKLQELKAGGLSDEAIRAIIELGTEEATRLANALTNNPALIALYNQTLTQNAELAKAFGEEVADWSMQGIVDGIEEAKQDVQRFFRKNPLKVNAELVFNTKKPGVKSNKGSVRSLNVTVQGNLVDPQGAARAIRQVLRDQDSREGVLQW